MQNPIWLMLFIIAAAGSVGGVVNAFLSDNGFLMPKSETTTNGATLIRPGYIGNILVGSVSSIVSWGLYGPLSALPIFGTVVTTSAEVNRRSQV